MEENLDRKLMLFSDSMQEDGKSEHTIRAYCYSVRSYLENYGELTRSNLNTYRDSLIHRFKPSTVNQRICSMNHWLAFVNSRLPRLKQIRVQQPSYIENVIDHDEYQKLIHALAQSGRWKFYYLIHFMASTGVRVSEVRQFTMEDIRRGYKDLYSKGGKCRRVYLPAFLQEDAKRWFTYAGITSGPVFLNRFGKVITDSGIRTELKYFAKEYEIPPEVVHPHSFRHHFAKTFLKRSSDIALLADLLGHTKLETTRIYLRHTSEEQKQMINQIVTW